MSVYFASTRALRARRCTQSSRSSLDLRAKPQNIPMRFGLPPCFRSTTSVRPRAALAWRGTGFTHPEAGTVDPCGRRRAIRAAGVIPWLPPCPSAGVCTERVPSNAVAGARGPWRRSRARAGTRCGIVWLCQRFPTRLSTWRARAVAQRSRTREAIKHRHLHRRPRRSGSAPRRPAGARSSGSRAARPRPRTSAPDPWLRDPRAASRPHGSTCS